MPSELTRKHNSVKTWTWVAQREKGVGLPGLPAGAAKRELGQNTLVNTLHSLSFAFPGNGIARISFSASNLVLRTSRRLQSIADITAVLLKTRDL